ncbi:ammonium transporter [Laetiporus sulphureus 93-53]|uniref:Ammonium transporter n=1 Tax=Laetiporus sulphureus 93-53 TaxID=1314785 RepID=A0A165E578_9APHY|nr:ammonium transporter [Laetiporus sulphureus 93-53]KZT06258.1 ammonium transporter [Laetiporus sulphureus 93-53]
MLVSFMVPGVAFLYSGLSRRKSALTLVWACAASNAVVIFQWWFWGYSLAFSPSATNGFIGDLRSFALRKVLTDPSPGSPLIPELLYSFFQMEFACVTVAILMGALAERGRVLPAMIFGFVWMTIVYCPIAYWIWGQNGWACKWGVLDFAGGGPVEIGSGVSGLAYSWVLGRRSERELLNFRPHNVSMVCMGTFMLWFGWLGFNGGSAFGANLRAVLAIWNSMIAAAMGGIVWCLLDYRLERKFTMVGFCSGTIAGLVAATPTCGYMPQWASLVTGIVVGICSNYSTKIKFFLRIDDALDLYAEHAVGGIVGLMLNALFADRELIELDGITTGVNGGWLNRNWKQLYIQFAYVCAVVGYSFVVTAFLAKVTDFIPMLSLRASPDDEVMGMDDAQIGEFATDYIEIRRDYTDWTPYFKEAERIVAAGDRHALPDTSPWPSQDSARRSRSRSQSRGRALSPGGSIGALPTISEKMNGSAVVKTTSPISGNGNIVPEVRSPSENGHARADGQVTETPAASITERSGGHEQ